jgi:hypothetical protein
LPVGILTSGDCQRARRALSDSENPAVFRGNHALLTVAYGNLAMPNGHGAAALV